MVKCPVLLPCHWTTPSTAVYLKGLMMPLGCQLSCFKWDTPGSVEAVHLLPWWTIIIPQFIDTALHECTVCISASYRRSPSYLVIKECLFITNGDVFLLFLDTALTDLVWTRTAVLFLDKKKIYLRCLPPPQRAPRGVSLSKHTSVFTCNYQQEVDATVGSFN